VVAEPGVLPLVVRAGAGSVRDALSVLDQLFGAAGADGVTYANATMLLGYTPEALLDETMDAFAANDGAGVYRAIDKVIETGQDPRHFAADLLQRLRDVLVVASVPDALSSGLIDVSADQGERLKAQADAMGQQRLTNAAEQIAKGLTGMRGTTAPRLHLELMCSRVLLPQEDVTAMAARLDKIERRLVAGVPAPGDGARPAPAPGMTATTRPRFDTTTPPSPDQPGQPGRTPAPAASRPAASQDQPERQWVRNQTPSAAPRGRQDAPPSTPPAQTGRRPDEVSPQSPASQPAASQPPASQPPTQSGAQSGATYGLAQLRQAWPSVLERVKEARRFSWIVLAQNSELVDVQGDVVTLGFTNPGARDSYMTGSVQVLAQALAEVTNTRWRVNAILTAPDGGHRPAQPARMDAPPPPRPPVAEPTAPVRPPAPAVAPAAPVTIPVAAPVAAHIARPAPAPQAVAAPAKSAVYAEDDLDTFDEDVSLDDADVDDMDAASLLSSTLGAELIEEDDDV